MDDKGHPEDMTRHVAIAIAVKACTLKHCFSNLALTRLKVPFAPNKELVILYRTKVSELSLNKSFFF